jgi:tyrosyl-tRNA synthetase
MDLEKKLELVMRPPTEEIITEKELKELLETKTHPQHYIGYEISGLLHLGILYVTGYKIKDLLDAGFNCCVLLADWHSVLNKKLGGDWDKIRKGAKYFEEAFKFFLGKQKRLKFILGSELYHNNDKYWYNVVKIAKACTLQRVLRCMMIMGRKETEKLDVAQIIYPPMQASDILELEIDLAHAGTDQRKVHMLLRDISSKIKIKKPVSLHNHLLGGLSRPVREGFDENPEIDLKISSKMSKSKPWTAIFIHDSPKQIEYKLNRAWCPEGEVIQNPVLELAKYVIFREKKSFDIERSKKFGGDISIQNYEELESLFKRNEIHPQDLKLNVARELSEILKPIMKHFEKPSKRKLLNIFK